MIWPVTSFKLFIVHVQGYILMTIGSGFLFWNQNCCLQIKKKQEKLTVVYMTAPFVISTKWDIYLEWIINLTLPRTEKLFYFELKQVMSLFTLGSVRVVLVVALVYSFPDVFNVIIALISPYTNQPFIAPIRWTRIVS